LLLSKKDNKYSKVRGGRSFKSNLLKRAFSLIPVGLVKDSSSDKEGEGPFTP
jgi:hypothetical protein